MGPDSSAVSAYGFVVPADAVRGPLEKLLTDPGLLPGVRTPAKLEPGDLAVRLTTPAGREIFSSGAAPGATAATDSVGLRNVGAIVTMDISPRLARALAAGASPASQLPAQMMMIVISAVLAIVGLVQLRRAEALAEARSRFVANVSHELRTPLAQISMFAETLSLGRERSATEARQFASIIHGEARRLTHLAESALRFVRREAGKDVLEPRTVDVGAELREAVNAFAPIADAADALVALEDVAGIHAAIDPSALRQIVLNLLDNAVKHGGRGTRVIIATEAVDGEARIVVDDSGPGVPEEWRRRVFGAYVKVDRGNNSGAGIGLSIVQDLVASSGGRVSIDDAPLGGARFVVTLPLARVSDRPRAAQPLGGAA